MATPDFRWYIVERVTRRPGKMFRTAEVDGVYSSSSAEAYKSAAYRNPCKPLEIIGLHPACTKAQITRASMLRDQRDHEINSLRKLCETKLA